MSCNSWCGPSQKSKVSATGPEIYHPIQSSTAILSRRHFTAPLYRRVRLRVNSWAIAADSGLPAEAWVRMSVTSEPPLVSVARGQTSQLKFPQDVCIDFEVTAESRRHSLQKLCAIRRWHLRIRVSPPSVVTLTDKRPFRKVTARSHRRGRKFASRTGYGLA